MGTSLLASTAADLDLTCVGAGTRLPGSASPQQRKMGTMSGGRSDQIVRKVMKARRGTPVYEASRQ